MELEGSRNVNKKLTLCETLRLLNDRIQDDDPRSAEMRDLVCLALYMAKRMATKLREYNEKWDADWLWSNRAYREALVREEATYRVGSKENALRMLEKIGEKNADTVDTVGK